MHLLERSKNAPGERIYRLTAQGRIHALGGRDPEERWARSWDGRWRIVLFDVPTQRNTQRERLRRYLRGKGFGCLQRSAWISPDPLVEERRILRGGSIDVKSILLLDAQACAGESDADIVGGAWDFNRINHRYSRHLDILAQRPGGAVRDGEAAEGLLRWAAAERESWLDAVTNDPLLPARILPPGYLGQQAWRQRVEAIRDGGQQLSKFNPARASCKNARC
jgi:phenylacetic acid degradation operon negative regulatory protein